MDGLLLINKPVGITSFDCIRRLRRITGVRKIGHAGTLDPLASGLMLILIGSGCKSAMTLTKLDKTYLAQITLGYTSITGDGEGVKQVGSSYQPTQLEVERTLTGFVGEIQQTPSAYSAIKINGQEAYKRARRGEAVDMPSRIITISAINLLNYTYPILELQADVSSGTYIRSLAEDIGSNLGTGAYLSQLVRTQVGEYRLENALDLDTLTPNQISDSLIAV